MQTVKLICSSSFAVEAHTDRLARAAIEAVVGSPPPPAGELWLVLDDSQTASALHTARISICLGDEEDPSGHFLVLPADCPPSTVVAAVERAAEHLRQREVTSRLEAQLVERNRQLEEINRIGIALSAERDLGILLEMILQKARDLSEADAGSLYLVESGSFDGPAGQVLRWKLAQNDSLTADFREKALPLTGSSLAGFVALSGEPLVIDDAYALPEGVPYSINKTFDQVNGYRTKSMVTVPMISHRGEMIGVLQLINRRRAGSAGRLTAVNIDREVTTFGPAIVELLRSLAAQAAVAVENNQLYESISRLFEGFVTASVKAIEQRDPTTSGHSFRVAAMTEELARAAMRSRDPRVHGVRFSPEQLRELRYAALLHDFGKVGVREQVLVKAKKLYPLELDRVRDRFAAAIRTTEAAHYRKVAMLHASGRADGETIERLDDVLSREIEELRQALEIVLVSNEPTVLPAGSFEILSSIAAKSVEMPDGRMQPLLDPIELQRLSVRKGNLDLDERVEIQSHVTHTFEFLSRIPWTRDLGNVPGIAYAHHERLNGRGYPRRLAREDIPLQSQIMAICDVYDALTAHDRPYKKAVPHSRALDILESEVRDGLLAPALFQIFVEAQVFKAQNR